MYVGRYGYTLFYINVDYKISKKANNQNLCFYI